MLYYTPMMFEKILHVLLHTMEDTFLTLPILFICYLLIELLEDKILNKYQSSKMLKNKFAPIVSAGFGLIPQCGFSVVATDLFSKKAITIGSLIAIFIATSDEALPLMLSNPNMYVSLVIILVVKFVYAVIIGMGLDAILSLRKKKKNTLQLAVEIPEKHEIKVDEEHCKEEHNHEHEHEHCEEHDHEEIESYLINEEIQGCCKHKLEKGHNKIKDLFVHPLVHSLKIFVFIVLFSFAFGCVVEFVGEDAISSFMSSTGFFEPFITAFIGLIPNCAASVLITQAFMMGGISLGSCIAGLCMNCGIALIMLFKMNKNIKENFSILGLLYILSCFIGVIINLF